MKTVIMGQNIVRKYTVNSNTTEITDDNGEKHEVFIAKPVIEITDKVIDEQICEFDGEIHYNSDDCSWFTHELEVTISGTVQKVIRTEFEVTTQTETVFTDKVLSRTNKDKSYAEAEFADLLGRYNKQIIESDEKMLKHCKLYNLTPADTDCEELFKEVYPGYKFEIDYQGKLKPRNIATEKIIERAATPMTSTDILELLAKTESATVTSCGDVTIKVPS